MHSADLKRGSTYPVKAELSTFISTDLMTLISAGIFYPLSNSMISPLTNFSAGIWVTFPSLKTLVTEGNIFLKPSIKAYEEAAWAKVIIPVIKMTPINTNPRTKLGKFPKGWTM